MLWDAAFVASHNMSNPKPAAVLLDKVLRFVGIAEGLSLLLLLFVAVPLKWLASQPALVHILGPIHGVLFLVWIGGVLLAAPLLGWNWRRVLLGWIASVVPFGTLLFEASLRREAAGAAEA